MALVAFIRGVNVGGHRRFRPTLFAKALKAHDVVSVGAAGTFIIRNPGARATLMAELRRRLPFDAEIAICAERDLLELEKTNPFRDAAPRSDVVRFVSVLTKAGRLPERLPIWLPNEEEWLVRVVAANGRFVFGEYRRHMRTIGYLGKLDAQFGAPVTTRNWNTIRQVLALMKDGAGR